MEKAIKIRPLFDRILLAPEEEQNTHGGIILPREMQDKSHIMRVVAIGDGTKTNLECNERVIVAKYAGTDVNIDGEKFTLVCEYDILGVFHE